jgi:hypothetical protein
MASKFRHFPDAVAYADQLVLNPARRKTAAAED